MSASGKGAYLSGMLLARRRRRLENDLLVKAKPGDASPAIFADLIWGQPERVQVFWLEAEASSGGTNYAASVSESATAQDSVSALANLTSSVSESASSQDSISTLANLGPQVSESASAQDSVSTLASVNSQVSESATAQDAASALASLLVSVNETASAEDQTSATLTSGANYAVSVSEGATAAESLSVVASLLVATNESAQASDAAQTTASLLATIAENAAAIDSVSASGGDSNALPGGHYWYEEQRKMWEWAKKKPTLAEVVEYVEDEPEEALEVAQQVAPQKVADIDLTDLRNNTKTAEFVARQLMVAIELRRVQVEREADEDDIESLLLLS